MYAPFIVHCAINLHDGDVDDMMRYACFVRDKFIFAALRQQLEVNLNDFR